MRYLVIFILSLTALNAKSEIYKVVDKQTGKITYTNQEPFDKSSKNIEAIPEKSTNSLSQGSNSYSAENTTSTNVYSRSTTSAEEAFASRLSNVQITGEGTVKKLLPQDNNGSRHQKFVLQLSSGQTLLVAHNIDLAPEIANLSVGDRVSFFGEYEWNEKDGVIHWTHHDPDGSHIAGWLRHRGRTYQ